LCAELNKRNYKVSNRISSHILILSILSVLIFFVNLGGWDLWNPDEPRYAQVAKEMMESGNWILPHLNSQVYPDKPPVFFWLIALSNHAIETVEKVQICIFVNFKDSQIK
jgi:4-amino-4-deoxy-L-arabinose transferase-like glycosyltransferase